MFDLIKIARLFRNAKAAVLSRDLDAILASAHDIAAFLGYGKEMGEVVAIVDAVKAGDVQEALLNLGDLAVLLAQHFATGGITTMASPSGTDELEYVCRALEAPQGSAMPMATAVATMDPGTIALLIRGAIALIQLIRERRKNK